MRSGMAILNRYPLPNVDAGAGHELQLRDRGARRRTTADAAAGDSLDYQLSSKLRVTGKYSGQRARQLTHAGHASRASTTSARRIPFITNYGVTVNYTLNPTTFVEGTYGFIRNQLAGGNERRHPRQRLRRTG